MSDYLEGKNAAAPDPSRPDHMRGYWDGVNERNQRSRNATAAPAMQLTSSEMSALAVLPIAIFVLIVFVLAMIALAWTAVLCGPVLFGALLLRRGPRGYVRALAGTAGAAIVLILAVIALISSGWPYGGPSKTVVLLLMAATLLASSYWLHRMVRRRSGIVRCAFVTILVATTLVVGTYVANQSNLSFRVAESIVGGHKANVFASLAEERSLYEWLDFSTLSSPKPMSRSEYLAALPDVQAIEAAVKGPTELETAAYREVVAYELKHIVLSIAPGSTFNKQLSSRERGLVQAYLMAAQRFKEEQLRARKNPDSPMLLTGFLLGTKLVAVSVIREHWPLLPRAYALHRRGRLK